MIMHKKLKEMQLAEMLNEELRTMVNNIKRFLNEKRR